LKIDYRKEASPDLTVSVSSNLDFHK